MQMRIVVGIAIALIVVTALLASRMLLAEEGSAPPVEVRGLKSLIASSTPSSTSAAIPVESGLLELSKRLTPSHWLAREAAWTSLEMEVSKLVKTAFRGREPLETQLLERLVELRHVAAPSSPASTGLLMEVSRLVPTRVAPSQPASSTALEELTRLVNSSTVVKLLDLSIAPTNYFRNGSLGAGILYSIEVRLLDPLGGVYALRRATISLVVGNRIVALAQCSKGSCLCSSAIGAQCRASIGGSESTVLMVLRLRIPWSVSGPARISVHYIDFLNFTASASETLHIVNAVSASIRINTSTVVEGGPVGISVRASYRGTQIPAPNLSIEVNGSAVCRTGSDGVAECVLHAPRKPGLYTLVIAVAHGPQRAFRLRVVSPQQALKTSSCVRGRYALDGFVGAGHVMYVDVHAYHLVPLVRISVRIESESLLEATYYLRTHTLVQRGVLRVTSVRVWNPDSEDTIASFAIEIPWNVSGPHRVEVTVVGAGVSRSTVEAIDIVNRTQVSRYEVVPYPVPPGSEATLRLVLTYAGTSIRAGDEVVYINGTRIVADPNGVAVFSFVAPNTSGRIVFVVDPAHGPATDIPVLVSAPSTRAAGAMAALGGEAGTMVPTAALVAIPIALTAIAVLGPRLRKRS